MLQRPGDHPGEPATPPNPLARAKNIARKTRWPAAGLVVLLVVLGIAFRHKEQWGDIATWVLAATTLLAFLAATFAGLVAYDLLKIETTRDQQAAQERALAADDRKRDHASHISFWLTLNSVLIERDEVYEPDAPYIAFELHIVNTSDRPATSVTAVAGIRGDVWRDASTADGTELDQRETEWTTPAIAPHDRKTIPYQISVPASVARIVDNYRDHSLIGELLFTDAAGTSWAKSYPDGQLTDRQSADWANNIHLSLTQRDQRRRDMPGA